MMWHFHSGHGSRAAMLVAGAGAALVAAVSLAPGAGAEASRGARTWTVQPSPNPKGALASGLAAVSCPDPGSCVAVGSSSYLPGHQLPSQRALVERFSDGAWIIAKIPKISGANSSALNGVSCPAAGYCVAIGFVQYTRSLLSARLLAETWNGTSWSGTILPNPSGGSLPSLTEVSCAATGDCVAVGNYIHNKSDTLPALGRTADRLGVVGTADARSAAWPGRAGKQRVHRRGLPHHRPV